MKKRIVIASVVFVIISLVSFIPVAIAISIADLYLSGPRIFEIQRVGSASRYGCSKSSCLLRLFLFQGYWVRRFIGGFRNPNEILYLTQAAPRLAVLGAAGSEEEISTTYDYSHPI